MDRRASVQVQESSKEAPGPHWSKDSLRLSAPKRVRRTFHFTYLTCPTRRHTWGPKGTSQVCDLSHKEKWEHVSECPASPAAWNASRDPLLSPPSRTLQWAAWLRTLGAESACGVSGLLEDSKGMQVLLTTARAPSRHPPTSCWRCHTCRSPQLAHGHPKCSECFTHTPHTHSMATSLCT